MSAGPYRNNAVRRGENFKPVGDYSKGLRIRDFN